MKTCTAGDLDGPIEREVVERGVRQDCVAFSQFIGAGVGRGGECTGTAETAAGPAAGRRIDYPKRRCEVP